MNLGNQDTSSKPKVLIKFGSITGAMNFNFRSPITRIFEVETYTGFFDSLIKF